jgi:hypothetical protein
MSPRLFQFNKFYPGYLADFDRRHPQATTCSYAERLDLLLRDRFSAVLILAPVYLRDPNVRYTVVNDLALQHRWAEEHQFKSRDCQDILLAQIEDHRAEVICAQVTNIFDDDFFRRLPGCVKKRVCYLSAPLGRTNLTRYDLCLSSHLPFVREWAAAGLRSAHFLPSHDPECESFAKNDDRPVDVTFIGSYQATHIARNNTLSALASLAPQYRVELRLMCPQWRSINVRFLRRFPIPGWHTLPPDLRRFAGPPVFGRQLYELLSTSKVVFNGAIDMSGEYRSNMRIFEALGCGSCMVSDHGIYPAGLNPGQAFLTYRDASDAAFIIARVLQEKNAWRTWGQAGEVALRQAYPKEAQWTRFQELLAGL